MNTIDIEKDIRTRLVELIKPEFIEVWLNSPNVAFENKKPIDLINEGHTDPIYRMLYILESGEPLG